eukprot:Platyproteum_vivax@DN4774_c0_g1_i1.p1
MGDISLFFDTHYRGYNDFVKRSNGYVTSPEELSNIARNLEKAFFQVGTLVEQESIFSKNEIAEDIPTENLKYLLIPYVLAHLSSYCDNLQNRLRQLKQAIAYYDLFLIQLFEKRLVEKADLKGIQNRVDKVEESKDLGQIRTDKIANHRRRRELQETVDRLSAAMTSCPHVDEETRREYVLSQLTACCLSTFEELKLLESEVPMLEEFEARQSGEKPNPVMNEPAVETRKLSAFTIQPKPLDIREHFKNNVFQPGFTLPTISLAECAEMEMMIDVETLGRKPVQTFDDHLTQAQKDDAKNLKDREWDDWKDDNPKGSGNKLGNIG